MLNCLLDWFALAAGLQSAEVAACTLFLTSYADESERRTNKDQEQAGVTQSHLSLNKKQENVFREGRLLTKPDRGERDD